MVMEIARVGSVLKDNVISVVAAIAALVYGYFEFVNRQQNQEKQFIEQFAAAVEKYSLPMNCEAIDSKPRLYLQIAISAAARLDHDFNNPTFREIINRLGSRYSEFEADCAGKRPQSSATPAGTSTEARSPLDVKAQALQRSNIQLQEVAAPSKAGAKWFTVVASLPLGEVAQARAMVCDWMAKEPELRTWVFKVYQTKLSKSTAVVVDGEVEYGRASQAAQLVRANPKFSRFFPDAFAQIDRDWELAVDKVACPA